MSLGSKKWKLSNLLAEYTGKYYYEYDDYYEYDYYYNNYLDSDCHLEDFEYDYAGAALRENKLIDKYSIKLRKNGNWDPEFINYLWDKYNDDPNLEPINFINMPQLSDIKEIFNDILLTEEVIEEYLNLKIVKGII